MEKTKNTVKKSIIRNTELSIPKAVVFNENETAIAGPSNLRKIQEKNELQTAERNQISLAEPVLNSALKIAKEIELVENAKPRKLKSITNLKHKKHLVVDEQGTKQLNLPHYQEIYKDLYSLCVNSQPQSLPSVTRDHQIIRDEEPILANFYTPKTLPEYSFQVPIQNNRKVLNKQYDGFKVYRTMRTWN